ncbi:unnamed protein product [Orchesella dallaii]
MSAILVLGFAGEIYAHGSLIAEMVLGPFIYIPVGGAIFLPTLYGLKLTSAYEYLGQRFKSETIRLLATSTFIAQIVLYMGVVLYAPSLALNAVVDFPIWISVIAVGGSAALYTSIGGLKAVVWTDCFQIMMMFSGMLAIIIQGSINAGGFFNTFAIASNYSRIEFLNLEVDPFVRHTSLNIFFGQGVFWLSSYGCHQTTVQRYCSMSSLKKAFQALLLTAPLVSFTMSLAVLVGIVIFANYAGCDPITLGFITKKDQIAPYFVLEFLSPTTGLMGLFIACLYSGALSTVSSGLNSLAAVTWQDFFTKIRYFRDLSDKEQGRVTKGIGFAYGFLIIGFGFAAGSLGGVLKAALVVNGTVAGPLLGVFLLGVLLPFVNSKGAISGMLIAHAISLTIGFGGLAFGEPDLPLPFSIDSCSNETLSKVFNITAVYEKQFKALHAKPVPVEGFMKIFNISYLLYPLVGTFITVFVGSVVSLLTGPSEMTKDDEKYIHPLMVKIIKKFRGKPTGSTVHVPPRNDHEMSWQNGNGASARSWTNDAPRSNGKPIRIGGQTMYDNAAFQDT